MSVDKRFKGEVLPFTRNGWKRQFRSGEFRAGGGWKQVEKVKLISLGSMGVRLEEVYILASWDIDKGGNKSKDLRKGQHFLSLMKGAQELAFAIHDKSDWRILTYDCSYYGVVGTQREAEGILTATKWRKWKN